MALPVTIPNAFANATASIPLSQLDANFNTLANAVNGISDGSETLANVTATVGNITTVNATTVDTTNIEVTNIKAKDGTAAVVLTDSTGAVAVSTPLTANGGVVFNEAGADVDFRVEGDTNANLLFVDASTDRVGIGTNAPETLLQLTANDPVLRFNDNAGGAQRTYEIGSVQGDFVVKNVTNGDTPLALTNGDDLVLTGGSIVIATNGEGIDFSASAGGGASSSILDDYEEGTWTPTVVGGSTAGTYTLSNVSAYYTKTGNQVTCWAGFTFSAASGGTGFINIGGLPFLYKASSKVAGSVFAGTLNTSASSSNGIILATTSGSSGSNVYPLLSIDNAGPEVIQIGGVSTSTEFILNFSYTVS